ncbi:MAG: hypothetical protein FJX68_18145 [Alphaproteobacteria bacterium]|nr:hypothetical protein [Alphaproteobacteria bacterium]
MQASPNAVDGGAAAHEFRIAIPFGLPAVAGAIVSLAMCYGTVLVKEVFGIPTLGLNPHVQAVLMWSSALLAECAL